MKKQLFSNYHVIDRSDKPLEQSGIGIARGFNRGMHRKAWISVIFMICPPIA